MVKARSQVLTKALQQEANSRSATIARLMHNLLGENEQVALGISGEFFGSLTPDALRYALHDDPVWLAFELAKVDVDKWDGDVESLSGISERALKEERTVKEQSREKTSSSFVLDRSRLDR